MGVAVSVRQHYHVSKHTVRDVIVAEVLIDTWLACLECSDAPKLGGARVDCSTRNIVEVSLVVDGENYRSICQWIGRTRILRYYVVCGSV